MDDFTREKIEKKDSSPELEDVYKSKIRVVVFKTISFSMNL